MGRQMVEAFLLQGANVSYSARTITNDEFTDFLRTLPSSNKATAMGTSLDVGAKTALDQWVNDSAEKFGVIDTVIANGMIHLFLNAEQASSCQPQYDQALISPAVVSLSDAHGRQLRSLGTKH